jgi:glycosyltransferase involved in cell wall biosynthesis
VLLVENTIRGLGGSYESLFVTARGLHRDRFEPVVLFFQENHFVEKLKALGIQVLIKRSPHFWERESYILRTESVRSRLPRTGLLRSVRRGLVALLRGIIGGVPMAWTVFRVLRREKIDLLHTNNNLQRDATAILAGTLARVPVVCHERQLVSCSAFTRLLSRKVRVLICISDAVLEFTRTSGARARRSIRVHNALDSEEFLSVKPSLAPGPPRVGIMGRIMPKKGQRYFVEAAALVREKFPEAEFYVIGQAVGEDRAYEEEVRELSRRLGIEASVKWTGYMADPLPLVASLDAVIHAAVEPEPFGRVVLEAMALGRPVVATNLGGPLEIIEDGVSGFLVKAGDPSALAEKIIALIGDPSLREKLRAGALSQTKERFGVEAYIRRIEDVYEEALAARAPAEARP